MTEGSETVGFSQEMVNAFMTITANGRGCIFTFKLKTNLKKYSIYNQFFTRK